VAVVVAEPRRVRRSIHRHWRAHHQDTGIDYRNSRSYRCGDGREALAVPPPAGDRAAGPGRDARQRAAGGPRRYRWAAAERPTVARLLHSV